MRFLALTALYGVALAFPASVVDPQNPEVVKILNRRNTMDLVTTLSKHKSILSWKPTSSSVQIQWDGIPVSCTCFKPAKVHDDHCDDPRFEMHMDNMFSDTGPTVRIHKKENWGKIISIFADLRLDDEQNCVKQGVGRKVCFQVLINSTPDIS